MVLEDAVRDREPEAGTLADLLRAEEGVEDAALDLRRDPEALVGDLELDPAVGLVAEGQADRAAAGHRVDGVAEQVEQNLFQLVGVREHLGAREALS